MTARNAHFTPLFTPAFAVKTGFLLWDNFIPDSFSEVFSGQVIVRAKFTITMATRRTHQFTSRADAGETKEGRRQRLKTLKAMQRQLTPEQLEELARLTQEFGTAD